MTRSREEQREELVRYAGDVSYNVWRAGGNADLVDYDRVIAGYYAGHWSEDVAREECRLQSTHPATATSAGRRAVAR